MAKYSLIKDTYSMKCRLYPNKGAAMAIDKAIYAVQCYHNVLLYDIYKNHNCCISKTYKPSKKKSENRKPGETDLEYKNRIESYELESKYREGDPIHFVDYKKAFSAEYKKSIVKEHPCINDVHSEALICDIGLRGDMEKSLGKKPIEFQKPAYYSEKKPRTSYTYRVQFNSITVKENEDGSYNRNVFYINLGRKIGIVKVRGWNQKIRFDESGETDFINYALSHKDKKVTITVSKDNCGDYWIVFTLSKIVYKTVKEGVSSECGLDVGIKDVVILSDGTKYANKKYKQAEKQHIMALQRRLSRRYGWSNKKFRSDHKANTEIRPSKRYEETLQKYRKLEREIARKRNLYNDEITSDIVNKHSFIGVETLNVSGMFRNKHLAYALSDVAMGSILLKLRYKSEWNMRTLRPIDKWTPSSKRCSCCGYVLPKLSLSTREWDCPQCGAHHDRDINAANNIKYYALQTYKEIS